MAFHRVLGVAFADPANVAVEGLVQTFVGALAGTGLANEDEVEAFVEGQSEDGAAAVGFVGDRDGVVDAGLVAMLLDPAIGGIALATLLVAFVGEDSVAGGGIFPSADETLRGAELCRVRG